MKVNKELLKFARDSRYIEKVLSEIFETFDITKLKQINYGYSYDDRIKITYWYGTSFESKVHFDLYIGDEYFDDEIVIGFLKSVKRDDLLKKFFKKFDKIYKEGNEAWNNNVEEIKSEFLCEMYKQGKINFKKEKGE
jgi:hypothetical protein